MGTCRVLNALLFLLFTAASWTLTQQLQCQIGNTMTVEDNPGTTFNWTTEKVDTCKEGTFCQETIILIRAAGTKTAVVASKSCISDESEKVTFIKHSVPPGLAATSYSYVCNNSVCNNRIGVREFWDPPAKAVMSKTLRCPTCVALGSCLSAPSLPCPNDTARCYQGKIELTGGNMNLFVEIKGCTAMTRCNLMGGIIEIGPFSVKETCTQHSLLQPRMAESGAPWLLTSLWMLELLLPLLFLPLLFSPFS